MPHPADNPVLAPWTAAFGGTPPFDAIRTEDFPPALEAAMAEKRADIAAITANPEPATFANTLEALEASGPAFAQAVRLLSLYTSAMNDEAMRRVQLEFAPKLAALADEITLDPALFDRLATVFDARESAGLDAEQQRLVEITHDRFTRRGAALDETAKTRLKAINQQLATQQTQFSQNVLAAEESTALVLDDAADLDGLPSEQVQAAAEAAKARGLPGKYAIANTRSAMEPFLTYAERRDLREKALLLWQARGTGTHDNRPIMVEILRLRAEKAKLLGYPSFAHWIVDGQMAKTPDAVLKLLTDIWHPAIARVREEVAEMTEIAAAEGSNEPIAPFDYRYYAEKLRKAKYAFDETEVKPYLQLDKMVEAMFWVAGELFDLSFTQIRDLPVYHPDVAIYEVTRNGQRVGLWYFDFYARPGKSSGAWMSDYRAQRRLGGVAVTPIVSNNANFLKPAPGEPALISWTDAVTLFHEFGHGLHGLNSDVTYPSLAGTAVLRDFVELPSQLLEHWLPTRALLERFARHHRTGEPMPKPLVDKLLRAQAFRQGFQTAEYLANALLDFRAHLAGDTVTEPQIFEAQLLAEIGMPAEMVLRHPMAAFTHIFASEGYAAGYYSYIWADTLTADAAEAFAEAPGGFYDKDLAHRLLDTILAIGNKRDPAEAFRDFRGRDASVDALMRHRGFTVPMET